MAPTPDDKPENNNPLLFAFILIVAVFLAGKYTATPAPPVAPVIQPVAPVEPIVPRSPCGPNRCPRR